MIEDKELIEMQEMEESFKFACKTHREYEFLVIQKRLNFQKECTHLESEKSDYFDVIKGGEFNLYRCKRCGKFIKKERK